MFGNNMAIIFTIFLITILFLLWRPRGLNESIPALTGAVFVVFLNIVNLNDLSFIFKIVSGASIVIISTIIMSVVLESLGFFRWAAFNIIIKSGGSGIRLYWYVLLMCFLMTVFFNNDGSILITTPIIIEIVSLLNLKPHQKLPYLLSGALIATASSAPIGVSNLANLISLKIVNLDLVRYAELMFIPSIIGLICMCLLLFAYFKKDVPIKISSIPKVNIPLEIYNVKKISHPLLIYQERNSADWSIFKTCMIIIILVRCSFFVLSYFHIPIEWAAIIGALVLIMIRWYHYGIRCNDIIKKTPWHIFLFAMSMYIIVYGMHVSGLTSIIIDYMRVISGSIYNAILSTGLLISFMSNIFNNLPSILIGTIIITNLGLDQQTLHVLYLATIIGSDIGSLVMPIGTLATLIWMFILKINKIPIPWKNYISVTSITIPISLLVTLLCLHLWTQFVFI